jgi:hypothetical protein
MLKFGQQMTIGLRRQRRLVSVERRLQASKIAILLPKLLPRQPKRPISFLPLEVARSEPEKKLSFLA